MNIYRVVLPSGFDDRELIAASLIKVPLVMNLYKAAELRRVNLEQVITIQESQLDHSYGELWQRGAGTTLTLRELAKLTLAESDNTASRAIFDQIQSKLSENEQSLAQLDIDQNTYDGQAVINARSYSSVLKSLYLSSYLNRDHSSELLNFLTQSNENTRLTKLLPSDLAVAHKNGVYNREWSESDCGIVYAKARPYSVCIMVGLPDDQAGLFMAETSKLIFDYVTSYQR
ncbi:serine hydrolase [bacterium]|nr:MAG: serine hydrolase [bacterium]